MHVMKTLALSVLAMLLSASSGHAEMRLTRLEMPEAGAESLGTDLSDDGRTVLARWRSEGSYWAHLSVWRPGEGAARELSIDSTSNGLFELRFASLGRNGRLVSASIEEPRDSGWVQSSLLWRNAGPPRSISDVSRGQLDSFRGVSDDGRTFFGVSAATGEEGFWTRRGGFEAVDSQFTPYHLIGNGSKIFGYYPFSQDEWTWAVVSRGEVPKRVDSNPDLGCSLSWLTVYSRDGSVGWSGSLLGDLEPERPIRRWTQEGGVECFDAFPKFEGFDLGDAYVHGITESGDEILGWARYDPQLRDEPGPFGDESWAWFLYSDERGFRWVRDALQAGPVGDELAGWTRLSWGALSADGRVMSGSGRDPEGVAHTFVVERWLERDDIEIAAGSNLIVETLFGDVRDPIEITVFGSEVVDVDLIDRTTLGLVVDGARRVRSGRVANPMVDVLDDVDGDGLIDLVLYFSSSDLGSRRYDRDVCLSGWINGDTFESCDRVDSDGAFCGRGFEVAILPVVAVAVRGRRRRSAANTVRVDRPR